MERRLGHWWTWQLPTLRAQHVHGVGKSSTGNLPLLERQRFFYRHVSPQRLGITLSLYTPALKSSLGGYCKPTHETGKKKLLVQMTTLLSVKDLAPRPTFLHVNSAGTGRESSSPSNTETHGQTISTSRH